MIRELALNGNLRPCTGVLPMIMSAVKYGIHKVIVLSDNLPEAKLIREVEVYGCRTLAEVVHFLKGEYNPSDFVKENTTINDSHHFLDFADVRGQDDLIDAVVLAATGDHNMIMIGTPGCGKTMVAQRIPTILPKMSEEESLEVTKIYSVANLLSKNGTLIIQRPFRSPHHNASLNALIGGGMNAMPGEVSLSHNGVLFLDELPEFSKRTLDALRQPIEDKKVCVSRVSGSNIYPSNFMFITAMNPCPCGYYPSSKCQCTDYEIIKYRNRISEPMNMQNSMGEK